MLFKIKSKTFLFDEFPLIVGVLNITPDSFYDGGKYETQNQILKRVDKMIEEGADIIDIGGESTRPYSKRISLDDERKRLLPALKKIKKNFNIPISIDTMKSKIADICLKEGAEVINDATGFLYDKNIPKIVAKHNAAVIINHTPSLPDDMQMKCNYKNLTKEISLFFKSKIKICRDLGVDKKSIILDPGIGFGKETAHNIDLIKNIKDFDSLKMPLMYGVSNKSFIGTILKIKNPRKRVTGSVIAAYVCIQNGAKLIRTHNIKETKEMIMMWRKLN
jgi:dihydropteroate synthase